MLADLALPGGPDLRADRIDLVITGLSHKEVARVESFLHAHRIVPDAAAGRPALAWRPDGGAVATISAPERGKLQLVIYDLATQERAVLAEKPGDPSGAYGGLSWAPGGRYLTFGEHLFDSQTGAFITEGVSRDLRWNPTGTHLLEDHRSSLWQAHPAGLWRYARLDR